MRTERVESGRIKLYKPWINSIVNKLRSHFKRRDFKRTKRSHWKTCNSFSKANIVQSSSWINIDIKSKPVKRNRTPPLAYLKLGKVKTTLYWRDWERKTFHFKILTTRRNL